MSRDILHRVTAGLILDDTLGVVRRIIRQKKFQEEPIEHFPLIRQGQKGLLISNKKLGGRDSQTDGRAQAAPLISSKYGK
jgi:hypothetical protein